MLDVLAKGAYRLFGTRRRNVEFERGTVSFTFDDFPASAATCGAEVLQRHGWRGTYYLSPGLLGADGESGPICTEDQVRHLHAQGHEIANHSYGHLRMRGASSVALRADIERSRQWLAPFDGNRSFAFPYGDYDHLSLLRLGRRFQSLRTTEFGINAGRVDLRRLKAVAIYERRDPSALEELVRLTVARRGWLILYSHDIAPNPSQWGCTPGRFEWVADMVRRHGCEVETVADVTRRLG